MSAERDETIRKLYRAGKSVRAIGDLLGISGATVSRRLTKLGEQTRAFGNTNKAKPRVTRVPFPDGVSPGGSLADGICILCDDFRTNDGGALLDHLEAEHGVPREKPAERPLRCRTCGVTLSRNSYDHVCEKSDVA